MHLHVGSSFRNQFSVYVNSIARPQTKSYKFSGYSENSHNKLQHLFCFLPSNDWHFKNFSVTFIEFHLNEKQLFSLQALAGIKCPEMRTWNFFRCGFHSLPFSLTNPQNPQRQQKSVCFSVDTFPLQTFTNRIPTFSEIKQKRENFTIDRRKVARRICWNLIERHKKVFWKQILWKI